MKNIMALLKEQKEAKRQSKKRDRGFRKILYPRTKADLLAGENMGRTIEKAIDIYKEYKQSSETASVASQDSENIELGNITTEDSGDINLSTTNFKNVNLTELHATASEKLDNPELNVTKAEDFLITELTNTTEGFAIIDLNVTAAEASENSELIELETILSPTPFIDEFVLVANDAVHNEDSALSKEIASLLTILEQTRYVNLASRFLFLKYPYEPEIALEELSNPNQAPINKLQNSSVVNFIKLNTADSNLALGLQNLQNPPAYNFENLNTIDVHQTLRSPQFNKVAPVVNFIKLNTAGAHQFPVLRDLQNSVVINFATLSPAEIELASGSHNFNNFSSTVSYTYLNKSNLNAISRLPQFNKVAPVVNFIKLNTAGAHSISRLPQFNKVAPVVNFIKLNTADSKLALGLQNLQNPPTVNFANLNTADAHSISRLRSFNKVAPVVNFIKYQFYGPREALKITEI